MSAAGEKNSARRRRKQILGAILLGKSAAGENFMDNAPQAKQNLVFYDVKTLKASQQA